VEAYYLLRQEGKNIPPKWYERSAVSRKNREELLGKLLKGKSLDAVILLKDWETAFKKECFYYGLRALLELERKGKTNL
jgi:hypothetical protein